MTVLPFPFPVRPKLISSPHQWQMSLSTGYVDRKPEATPFMVPEKSARGFSFLKGVARVTKSNVMIKGK